MTTTATVRQATSDALLEQWAAELTVALEAVDGSIRMAIEASIAFGEKLLECKRSVPHGGFCRLFRGYPTSVANAIPINVHHARHFMRIARSPTIRKHIDSLPRQIYSLFLIAQAPPDVIDQGVAAGVIHPRMPRPAVVDFVRKARTGVIAERTDAELLQWLERDVAQIVRRFQRRNPTLAAAAVARAMHAITTCARPASASRGDSNA